MCAMCVRVTNKLFIFIAAKDSCPWIRSNDFLYSIKLKQTKHVIQLKFTRPNNLWQSISTAIKWRGAWCVCGCECSYQFSIYQNSSVDKIIWRQTSGALFSLLHLCTFRRITIFILADLSCTGIYFSIDDLEFLIYCYVFEIFRIIFSAPRRTYTASRLSRCARAKNPMKHNWRQLAIIVELRIANAGIIDKSKTGAATSTTTATEKPGKCEPFSFPKKVRTVFIL